MKYVNEDRGMNSFKSLK